MRCPVQTEEASDIGFLSYTSQYNDKEYIAKQLSKVCGYEIGVRLAAVTNKVEHTLDWKKKTRGLIVVAPSKKAEQAKDKLTTVFMARKAVFQNTISKQYDMFHTFSFLPLEQDVVKMPNCAKNFNICLQRHQVHYKSIRVRLNTEILINLNRKVATPRGRMSLRQMILQIKSNVPKTKGAKIFQSIDCIEDSSKVYFPNLRKNGPKAPGFIFQFYQLMEEEANMMIKGLGVYLSDKYGEDPISPLFSAIHWNKNKHWAWSDEQKTFVTPDEKIVAELVHLDFNAVAIGREALLLAQEEQHSKTKKLTPAMKMLQQQEQELINLLKNPDLDPITKLNQPVQEITDSVEFNNNADNQSATSSITDLSQSSGHTKVTGNHRNTTHERSNNMDSSSTISSVKTSRLRGAIDPNLSVKKNKQHLRALAQIDQQRLEQRQTQLLAELEQLELQEEPEKTKESQDINITQTKEDNKEKNYEETASGLTTGTEK